jgi:hypothetical protein
MPVKVSNALLRWLGLFACMCIGYWVAGQREPKDERRLVLFRDCFGGHACGVGDLLRPGLLTGVCLVAAGEKERGRQLKRLQEGWS